MAWTIRVKALFSAAHEITVDGVPEGLHGHNYLVEVFIEVQELGPEGIGVDFRRVKASLRRVLPNHQLLNRVMDEPPSAELIAKYIYEKLKPEYPGLKKVVVWETPEQGAEYEP